MKIPFYRMDVGGDEREKIDEVLDGEAPHIVEELEEAFAAYVGASHALATSDGTSALHLAMLAIDLKRGDKVLCSINAYPSIPEVVRHFDAEPVFVDIDAQTLTMDLSKVESYLYEHKSKKLKAIILSHVAGMCHDLKRLYALAHEYDVKVIEDASDALGGEYEGMKIGASGADIVCFDFSPHLRPNACNGGMLVSESEAIMERARLLRHHAMVVDSEALGYIYDIVDIGSQYTMSPMDAAILLVQLEKHEQALARQKAIADRFFEALEGVAHISLPLRDPNHVYSLYILRVDKNRDSFARELAARGVQCGLHYIPLHLLSYYKHKYLLRVNDFPIALRAYQQVLSIPNHPSLSDKEVDTIIQAIKEVASTRI